MPGPGGGAHGGGGGHHNSGMHRQPHRRMYGGGWFYGPRFYGGGCLSGLFGIFLLPVFFVLMMFMMFMMLFSITGSVFSTFSENGVVNYDENKFQDYADSQYAVEFGSSTAYEDNILLVFLADGENYADYYYIAWIGDHIVTDINYMFGNENTELGRAISSSINTNSYKYSLDSNIAQVISTMESQIVSKNLESSFTCEETHIQVGSHLVNKTDLDLTEETVNLALENFTDTTGIPIVVVVEDIVEVFPKKVFMQSIVTILIFVVVVTLFVYLFVRNIRNRKNNINNSSNGQYYDCHDWKEN